MKKFLLCLIVLASPLLALDEHELEWKEGPSVQEYNHALRQALSNEDWWAVIDYSELISYNFATTPFAKESSYLMGEAYFKLGLYESANECFTAYLNHVSSPKHFEEAVEYKYCLLYTSPSPRDRTRSRMPSSA